MNKDINIDISEKDGILYCTVELPVRTREYQKKLYVNTKMVKEYLIEKKYKLLASLESHTICNFKPSVHPVATWAFALEKPKPTPRKRTAKPKPKPKTTKE